MKNVLKLANKRVCRCKPTCSLIVTSPTDSTVSSYLDLIHYLQPNRLNATSVQQKSELHFIEERSAHNAVFHETSVAACYYQICKLDTGIKIMQNAHPAQLNCVECLNQKNKGLCIRAVLPALVSTTNDTTTLNFQDSV